MGQFSVYSLARNVKRSLWCGFCLWLHALHVSGDFQVVSFLFASLLPGTFGFTQHQQHLPTFGSGSVSISPAKGASSAKFMRPGVKGGVSISRHCKNCASFALYAGWNMPMGVVTWQMLSDFVITAAYVSIPIQLYFFVKKNKSFPYALLLVQFSAFSAMFGLSHFIELLSYGGLPPLMMLFLTSAKLVTALISCSAAVTLYNCIPDFFTVHERSLSVKNKSEELGKELSRLSDAIDSDRQLRLIGQRISSSLDRGVIVSTALLELRDLLSLENAALWLPSATAVPIVQEAASNAAAAAAPPSSIRGRFGRGLASASSAVTPSGSGSGRWGGEGQSGSGRSGGIAPVPPSAASSSSSTSAKKMGKVLELIQECEDRPQGPVTQTVPLTSATASEVISARQAIPISSSSKLAEFSVLPPPIGSGWVHEGGVAAVALPLLTPAASASSDQSAAGGGVGEGGLGDVATAPRVTEYGVIVLVLPAEGSRKFRPEVLDLVDVVVEQLSQALLHATALEDSRRSHEALLEQEEQLRQAEAEGKSAVKARDRFLQVMNAKMRTPMHAITALSSILAETNLSDEQCSMAETVAFSSTLLASLLYDILEFWRLEEGQEGETQGEARLKLAPEQFELPALVSEAETLSSPIAKDKGLMVTFKADPLLPEGVVGDGNRLLQVLLNVVGNAIRYTHTGSISVSVSPERMEWSRDGFVLKAEAGHTFVRFEVTDTGADLNPEDIPKLFEKFQDDEARVSRTGLGMALARKFVQLMDGHIWVDSNGPGKGAICRFIVKLKLDTEGDGEGGEDEYGDEPDVNFFALKIMVVDDNMVNRIVTKRLLDKIGISTRCVDSGKECLRILSDEQGEEKYDVLLLDLMMPEMDGYTVARKISTELSPELRPMIVALTANADELTKGQCLKNGMAGMITKPISLHALRDVLGKMLEENAKAE